MYILEGNIGAGKSTFLALLAKHLSYIHVVQEPVASWQRTVDGESILDNFFKDPHRWAYTFETLTMMCRIQDHRIEQLNPNPNRILERSLYSGHYCFARNCYHQGFMKPLEWELYNQWFNFLVPTTCKTPLGFIYLKTDPHVAYTRIQKRNRHEEQTISLTYLQQIHAWHDAFLIDKTDVLPELHAVPVLVLDCNEEFATNEMVLKGHLQKVEQFMQQTQLQPPVQAAFQANR